MQPEVALRPNVTKSVLKGTVAVLVLSLFLEIRPSTYVGYLIFLGLYYLMLFFYVLFKESSVYRITDEGISIKRLRQAEISASYDNIQNVSYSQGMLARRFHCGTVYVELKKGKGTHKATTGKSLYLLRDVPNPTDVYAEILSRVGPYVSGAVSSGEAPPASA